jgi:hypothetical protein
MNLELWKCAGCGQHFDSEPNPQAKHLACGPVCMACYDLWMVLKLLEQRNGNKYWTNLQVVFESERDRKKRLKPGGEY